MTKLTYTAGDDSIEFDMSNPEHAAIFHRGMTIQNGAPVTSTLIAMACAQDIAYLKAQRRYTRALGDELQRLHRAGTPPDIATFGV